MNRLRRFFVIMLVFAFYHVHGFSQILDGTGRIPLDWQVDWTNAGLLPSSRPGGFLPATPTSVANIHVITHGGDYNAKVRDALNAAEGTPGSDLIYFPGGIYELTDPSLFVLRNDGTHNHSNIIFRGAGANQTIIKFTAGKDGTVFDIQGIVTSSDFSVADISKGSYRFTSNNFDGTPGDWIHIHETTFPAQTGAVIGQITQIYANVTSRFDSVKDAASKEYINSRGLVVRRIQPIANVGIEDLTIIRMDGEKSTEGSYTCGNNIKFDHAVNCWVKGVHLQNTCRHHISISRSSHIEVNGCLIQFAQYYGGDSYGYGIALGESSTNCLIENNIFASLRHSMGIGTGANCNVLAYNYSTTEQASYTVKVPKFGWPLIEVEYKDSDLCLHGRFSYANLYEHNYVEWIEADDTHGQNGYYNAFVRNKVYDWDDIAIYDTRYFSVLGCETDAVSVYGLYNPYVDEYGYRNSQWYSHSAASPYNKSDFTLGDVSYYYSSTPDFLGGIMFPSIGPRRYTGEPVPPDEIPAHVRSNNTDFHFTYLPSPTPFPLSSSYEITTGDANESITKISSDATISFIDDPLPEYAPGAYICDVYELSSIIHFCPSYAQIPSCWLNYYGYSYDSSNNASHYLNESSAHAKTELKTYFYFIKWNSLGQEINEWAPYNPYALSFEYGVCGIPGTNTLSGSLPHDESWCGTHTLTGDVTVPSGITLTILPGTTVRAPAGKKITVSGILKAQGTSSQRITFDKSGSSSWWGIKFENSSVDAECILDYCTIKNTNYGAYCNYASPTITNCSFESSIVGIYNYYSPNSQIIRYNLLWLCSSYGMLLSHADREIRDNSICSGTAGSSGLRLDYSSSSLIVTNEIYNMPAHGVILSASSPVIVWNDIYDNSSNGVYCTNYSNPYFFVGMDGNNVIGCNSAYGVRIDATSIPILGGISYGGDKAENSLYLNTLKEVYSQQATQIVATYNYWGAYPPDGNRFQGNIDYSNALQTDPNPGRIGIPKSVAEDSEGEEASEANAISYNKEAREQFDIG